MLRVATAAGYVDEAVLDEAHQAEHVTPLGAVNIGGGRQVAFVLENVGVAGENVGLWGLHDRDGAPCELARVTAPDRDASPLFPVRATAGSTAALACHDFEGDGEPDLVEYKALREADSDTYEWTEQAWTWQGVGQLASVGQDSGTTQSPQAGLDCPNIGRS